MKKEKIIIRIHALLARCGIWLFDFPLIKVNKKDLDEILELSEKLYNIIHKIIKANR